MDIQASEQALLQSLGYLKEQGVLRIKDAIAYAKKAHQGQTREGGDPYVIHPLSVAKILAEWHADADSIVSGLLHDILEDTSVSHTDISEKFGEDVAWLVEGVTKFTQADFIDQESLDRKVETLRKLFDVMRKDIRIAVIKLADRLHNIRTMEAFSLSRQTRFATETMNIYYKLAQHLGMNTLRREFSDRCIPILNPDESKTLLHVRDIALEEGKNIQKQMMTEMVEHDAHSALKSLRVEPHSLFTILAKKEVQRGDEPPYVLVAIAKDIDGCYQLLKLFHTLWRPISSRFRDYIAVPTESAYQTIRTTIIGPNGQLLPVRIRTEQMDLQEQYGVLLKCYGDDTRIPGFSWLKRSEELDISTKESSRAFWEALQTDIFQESITVQVNGEPLAVPKGATVLDSIYALYGAEASRTIQSMLNGSVVSFGHQVRDEDNIAVKLDARPQLQFEWLSKVVTGYARTLIVDTLKEQELHTKLALGQRLLQAELDHFHKGFLGELGKSQKQKVVEHYERPAFDDVITMIGEGVIQARDVVFQLFPEEREAKRFWHRKNGSEYPFRMLVRGTVPDGRSVVPQLLALAHMHETVVQRTSTLRDRTSGTFRIFVIGKSPNRLRFADLLAALERHEDISFIHVLLTIPQRLILLGALALVFVTILAEVLLLPWYVQIEALPNLLHALIPLIPIVAVNHILLRVLQHYIVALRGHRWYTVLGFLFNVLGLLLVTLRGSYLGNTNFVQVSMAALFVICIAYFGLSMYRRNRI